MIAAVIMAGGKGTRFWPKSRDSTPKQNLRIISNKTMLEETVDRLKPIFPRKKIFISTNKALAGHMKKIVPEVSYIIEPMMRDTAAAIGLAAITLHRRDKDALMFVETTDHIYKNEKTYLAHINEAINLAKEGVVVQIGIKPTEPHTGYGYIEQGMPILKGKIRSFEIKQFKEKPNLATAKTFVKKGTFLWNSGILVTRCDVLLKAIQVHMPKLHKALTKIADSKFSFKVAKKEFQKLEKISLEYGVIEKMQNSVVVRAEMHWDDVGDWNAMDRIHKKDKYGNVTLGKAVTLDTKNTIILGDKLVATYGVEDLIIVNTDDAVLVIPKDKAQHIKDLVNEMEKKDLKKYLE